MKTILDTTQKTSKMTNICFCCCYANRERGRNNFTCSLYGGKKVKYNQEACENAIIFDGTKRKPIKRRRW